MRAVVRKTKPFREEIRMKNAIIALILGGAVQLATAQEQVSREEALKVALLTHCDLTPLATLPVRVDADLKYPFALRAGEYGAMILPETKLTAEALVRAGRDPVPLGELWARKLTLVCDGQPCAASKLFLVTLPRQEGGVPVFALAVRQGKEGQLELLVYGKDKQPLLTVPLKKATAKQEYPLELTADPQGDQGRLTIRVCGKYEAELTMAKAD